MIHPQPKSAEDGNGLSNRWAFSLSRGAVHGVLFGIIISSLNLREMTFIEAFLSLKAIAIDSCCVLGAILLFAFFLYEQRLKTEAMIR